MTSQTIPASFQYDLEGRSVRDVVASSPGEVNDAWCRKVLHRILQSVALQYAMQMPHRAITIDTIVFHANGAPLLISDDIDAAPAPDARQADDLAALAGVIHFAITHEPVPARPLAGRAVGYSAALVATVDACMDPDPARRPRSIDAALGMLGMAAPEPAAGVSAPPTSDAGPAADAASDAVAAAAAPDIPTQLPAAPIPSVAAPVVPAADRPTPRWAIAGGGAVVVALIVVLFAVLRDSGVPDQTVPAAPSAASGVQPAPPVQVAAVDGTKDQAARAASVPASTAASVAPAGATASDPVPPPADTSSSPSAERPPADIAASHATGTSTGGTTESGGADRTAAGAPDRVAAKRAPASVAPPVRNTAPAHANYQLQIKPWGTVYVDGAERGVSPPLKRLALTPGRHTIRITNPDYRDSILEFDSAEATSNGKIIVDFTHEGQ